MSVNETTELNFGDDRAIEISLSERARGMVGSEILKIASRIREMGREGIDVCNLTVGDFNSKYFPIPDSMMQHIHAALNAGHTNYPPSDGVLELRQAVTRYVARTWGPNYPLESVLVTSGARPILYSAYRALVDPGETVVYPVPSWNNDHYCWMTAADGVAVPTRAEDGFMLTVDQLAPHLSRARLIAINSPLNPTGTVIGEKALRSLTEAICEENQRRERDNRRRLFLLHDQVYAALVFGQSRHHMPTALVPEAAPWVITLDGISKAFAATGLRVGWVVAAPKLVGKMKAAIGHIGAWAPRPEQMAVAAFLDDENAVAEFQKVMNQHVEDRLHALYRGFEQLRSEGFPVTCIDPQGAIYLSLRIDLLGKRCRGVNLDGNEAIRKLLLDEATIGVVPFQAFGLDVDSGWFRLSVGAVSMREIEEMFPRLRALLKDVED